MKRKLNIFKGIRQAIWASGIALLANGAVSMAETTKVDERTVVVTADPVKKEVSVEFRLVDGLAVTGATAVSMPAVGKGESLTATWEAWGGEKAKPCAWMIVVGAAANRSVNGVFTASPEINKNHPNEYEESRRYFQDLATVGHGQYIGNQGDMLGSILDILIVR